MTAPMYPTWQIVPHPDYPGFVAVVNSRGVHIGIFPNEREAKYYCESMSAAWRIVRK